MIDNKYYENVLFFVSYKEYRIDKGEQWEVSSRVSDYQICKKNISDTNRLVVKLVS